MSIKKDEETLKGNSCPHIVVGTPGRILALVRDRTLNLKNTKHFILDECDKMLEQLGKHFVKLLPFVANILCGGLYLEYSWCAYVLELVLCVTEFFSALSLRHASRCAGGV